jgi:hypothetical protein
VNGSRHRLTNVPAYEYGRDGRREDTSRLAGTDRREAIREQTDVVIPRAGRKRGPRCATHEVMHMLVGGRLIDVRRIWRRGWRCFNRCERGQTLCVKCRAVNRALADAAETT